jgi:hypothetical protein
MFKYEPVNNPDQKDGAPIPWKCPLHGIFYINPLDITKELHCPSCPKAKLRRKKNKK